jgi:lipopolysaccharide/colanic/teichoic acid biosynthesis glycosyltransferase
MSKRLFDLLFAGCGLVILSPALVVLAALVKLADGGPILFSQQRVGRGGRLFWILKFRSMVVNAERLGLSVTAAGDPRITRPGRFLRRTKLDELPQLWNVWRGEMSFVGPRPEVPGYVAKYTSEQKLVLRLKPGITDLATLEFRHEEELLLKAPNPGRFYLDYCIPRKIELNLAYAETANLWKDTRIILQTLGFIRTRPAKGGLGKPSSAEHPLPL